MDIEHWMTFGTFAEQNYFIYPKIKSYNGVIINGNMAAYAPDGLAAFLLERTKDLSYIIDPLTHAFQHNPMHVLNVKEEENSNDDKKKYVIKKSIKNLADAYGTPIIENVGNRAITPQDFQDKGIINEFVFKCLEFQKKVLTAAMIEADSFKYVMLDNSDIRPSALIAPYFYISEPNIDYWLPINVELADISSKLEKTIDVYASIVIDQNIIISDGCIDKIINSYKDLNLKGYIIWIDNFDEHSVSKIHLLGLLKFVKKLKESNPDAKVINLHGGYFSILAAGVLFDNIFSGVAHGPEFGELRSVLPIGGGIPIAKYYIPKLHKRINYKLALGLFKSKDYLKSSDIFKKNVCDCIECNSTIDNNIENFTKFGISITKNVKRRNGIVSIEYPTSETKERCLKHYLNRKSIEYSFASDSTYDEIKIDLENGIKEFGIEETVHLKNWLDVSIEYQKLKNLNRL